MAPWAPTGYGQQCGILASRFLNAGHDVMISATNGVQYTEIDWDGIKVYPADHTGLNKRMLRHHIQEHYGSTDDVQVISLWDIWPWIDPLYGGMQADFDGLRIAAWVPVDSDPLTPKTGYAIEKYQVTPIAMSRFGEQKLRERQYDPLYAPHGIETDVYKPSPNRQQVRDLLNVPEDGFLVGMVAHNEGLSPPRKNFNGVLWAFAAFAQEHPDAILYLHTELSGVPFKGLNILAHAERFGVPHDQFRAVDQTAYLRGNISRPEMAEIYSAFDVLINPSFGEGFGLPIVEAQACGVPVIVSHFSSMPELVGAGWSVGGQPFDNEASGAAWFHPATDEIHAALGKAYEARGDQQLRDKAREFALQYDADRVFAEHWVPVLEQLDKPRVIPPLPSLNREERQKLAKGRKVAA